MAEQRLRVHVQGYLYKSKNKNVGVLYYPYIGSTPTYLYFDLYLNTAYAAHYVYVKHVTF